MKKTERKKVADDLRPEYDLAKLENGERAKHLAGYRAGTNLVLLSPDVAKHFPDERAVNDALRKMIEQTKSPRRRTR
jgi:hypothetical protein